MCSVLGCDGSMKEGRTNSFGYCPMHLTRHYRYKGEVGEPGPRIKRLGDPSLVVLLENVESSPLAPDKCWIWSGNRNSQGYGNWGRKRAHRVSYQLFHDSEIPPGHVVMHSCDNPPCVNPKHLSVGTPQDNTKDMVRKGRQRGAAGSRNSNAKLSESDIPIIRSRYFKGESQTVIA